MKAVLATDVKKKNKYVFKVIVLRGGWGRVARHRNLYCFPIALELQGDKGLQTGHSRKELS